MPMVTLGRPFWIVVAYLYCCLALPIGARAENYAFLVGIQNYNSDYFQNLNFARDEIEEFALVLQDSGFKKENVVVLTDRTVNNKLLADDLSILSSLRALLANVKRDDTVIVALSGYAVQFSAYPEIQFCPTNADLRESKGEHLAPFRSFYRQLQQCPAEKKLMLADICRAQMLSKKGQEKLEFHLEKFPRPQSMPVPKGISVLFSCSAGQESREAPELRRGIFFHHLIEAWDGAATAGQPLTLTGLASYCRSKVPAYARTKFKTQQLPLLKSDFKGTWALKNFESSVVPTPAVAPFDAAAARKLQRTWSRTLNVPVDATNSIGMRLCLVPPGEFEMGNEDSTAKLILQKPTTPPEWVEDAYPRHRVKISKPFQIGKYEVTREQFSAFVTDAKYITEPQRDGKGGSGYDPETNRLDPSNPKITWRSAGFEQTNQHPVVNISWNDATKFCEWLSTHEKATYRLPTEAEWEYACRAGTVHPFQNGRDLEEVVEFGNVADRTFGDNLLTLPFVRAQDGFLFPAPVGQFRANQFGLHDTHGNVWEMCRDWYDEKYYTKSPPQDPIGPPTGTKHVLRGGSWYDIPTSARSSGRHAELPSSRGASIGFRVLKELPPS